MDTFERVPGSLAETKNVLTITGHAEHQEAGA